MVTGWCRCEHQVRWFDIAVDYALGVRRFQAAARLDSDLERLVDADPGRRDPAVQRDAVQIRHRDEQECAVLLHAVYGADVRMIDRCNALRFPPKTLAAGGIA